MSEQCKGVFRKATSGVFTDQEIDAAVERIIERRNNQDPDLQAQPAQSIRDILDNATREEIAEFARRKRAKAHDVRADAELKLKWEGTDAPGEIERLQAFIVGRGLEVANGHMGLDQIIRSDQGRVTQNLMNEITAAGLTHLVKGGRTRKLDPKLDQDIYTEIARANGGPESPTGNAEAEQLAQILAPFMDRARTRQNAVGAEIGKIDGYVGTQAHDTMKVAGGFWKGMGATGREMAMNRWIEFIEPRLHARTFEGVKDKRAFLEHIWGNIVTGRHERSSGASLDGALADVAPSVGSSALARRISQERVLHFRSAEDGFAYKQEFGAGSTVSAILRDLEMASTNEILMRYMGPNPEAKFETLSKWVLDQYPPQDKPRIIKSLRSRRAEFDQVTGVANSSASPRVSQFVSYVKTLQVVSKLGGMTLSSIGDANFGANTLARAGMSRTKTYHNITQGVFRKLDRKNRRVVGNMLGNSARVIAGSNVSRYSISEGSGGFLNRMQNTFYKLNLFTDYQIGFRDGIGAGFSEFLGGFADTNWAGLREATQKTLESYGIDGGLWDVVRRHTTTVDEYDAKAKLLLPDAAKMADEADVMAWAKTQGIADIGRARREIELRMDALFMDISDRAMTEPKARERALLRFGSEKGTTWGAFLDLMMQFKSFPATVITQHIIPAAKGSAGLSPKAQLANIFIANMVLGYVAMQAKQVAAGKTMRPLSQKSVLAGMIQGGGMGIFGDFLFSDYSGYGNSIMNTFAGPSVGTLDGFLKTMQTVFTEEKGDGKNDTLKSALSTVKQNMPFANLFYTKAALDYLVIFNLQETVSPGSLKRMEQRLERDFGQQYRLPPTRYIPKGGASPTEYIPALAEEVF